MALGLDSLILASCNNLLGNETRRSKKRSQGIQKMSEVKCSKCKKSEWIIVDKTVGSAKTQLSVKCLCANLDCDETKQIFINVEIVAEDFN